MITTAEALAAVTIGLMGSTHCAAMCGGITAAISLGVEEQHKNRWSILLGFQLGRVLSYTVIALLLGSIASYAATEIRPLSITLRIIAGGLLIAMGLYVASWWQGVTVLEKIGVPLWRRIQPLTRSLLPVKTLPGALALGGLWGWLPCGLVYSTLAWAISAGDTGQAAARMMFFGLGTLPTMFAMGLAADRVRHWLQDRTTRRIAGVLLILFGCWTLATPIQQISGGHDMSEHAHHR